jgi:hypothetical protein
MVGTMKRLKRSLGGVMRVLLGGRHYGILGPLSNYYQHL